VRRFFAIVNKLFMVPMFKLGLGPFFGNPITGYVMILKVLGRKTGRLRYVPVNYAIRHGMIYCLVGFGRKSPWYLNIMANPEIDLILPSGAIAGHAEEVVDAAEKTAVIRGLLKNAGWATMAEGLNPYRASDEALRTKTADQPLLRIRPVGPAYGPSDPGGWVWLWAVVATVALIVGVVLIVR
jgi:deazaflavin-dependent oxidoreductase (nitroreductase family)